MTTRDTSLTRGVSAMRPLQLTAAAVGAVFLLVGVLGFVPGVTAKVDDIGFIGHESEAKLLGLFRVNIVHNLVHLLFGVAGVAAARTVMWSKNFLVYGGAAYLVLLIYGLVIDLDSAANFISLNTTDNWLHLGLGVGMIALGLLVPRMRDTTAAR